MQPNGAQTFRRLAHVKCHVPNLIKPVDQFIESLNSEVNCFPFCTVFCMFKGISVTRLILVFDLLQCKMMYSFVDISPHFTCASGLF